jgi:RES domain-containing protein
MPDRRSPGSLTLWRAYVPRWVYDPLSGEGPARFGGRWNPVGQAATYAARELSTAWAEYNQGFVQHPATIVQLVLTGAALADLTQASTLAALEVGTDIHRCEWRSLLDYGKRPPTHALCERLLAEGVHGVIYPSFMSPGGTCVALWRWNGPDEPRLAVVDPRAASPSRPHRGCEPVPNPVALWGD